MERAKSELEEVEELLSELEDLRGSDTKRDRFFNVLRELTRDGRPVLVFTEHLDTLYYLRGHLETHYEEALGCYSGRGGERWVDGEWHSVTKAEITAALGRGELRILLCTDAASEGLNLQAAGALVNYDLPWNPSRVEQRIGRIDRIGQRYPTILIRNLFLRNSVDARVYSVLRTRCGLFENFVGAMQPVLARAGRMILGQEDLSADILEQTARAVDQDAAATAAYESGRAAILVRQDAAVSRDLRLEALRSIPSDSGIKVAMPADDAGIVEIRGLKRRTLRFAVTADALERAPDAGPLALEDSVLRDLADRLRMTGERLPLVVGTWEEAAFRSSVAYWAGEAGLEPVTTLRQLQDRLKQWDGAPVEAGVWHRAEETAQRDARRRVEEMRRRAADRELDGRRA